MSVKKVMLDAADPEASAGSVAEVVRELVVAFMTFARQSKDYKSAAVFMDTLLSCMVGYCAAVVGPDATRAVLARLKDGLDSDAEEIGMRMH